MDSCAIHAVPRRTGRAVGRSELVKQFLVTEKSGDGERVNQRRLKMLDRTTGCNDENNPERSRICPLSFSCSRMPRIMAISSSMTCMSCSLWPWYWLF